MSPDLLQKYLKILIACHNKTAHNFSIFVYALGNQQKIIEPHLETDEGWAVEGERGNENELHNT